METQPTKPIKIDDNLIYFDNGSTLNKKDSIKTYKHYYTSTSYLYCVQYINGCIAPIFKIELIGNRLEQTIYMNIDSNRNYYTTTTRRKLNDVKRCEWINKHYNEMQKYLNK